MINDKSQGRPTAVQRHAEGMVGPLTIPLLWPPCVADAVCSSPILSGRRLDVCHTSTHGVALSP